MYIEKGSLSDATILLLNDAVDAVDAINALVKVEKAAGLNRGVSARSRVIIVPRSGVVKGRKNKERCLSHSCLSETNTTKKFKKQSH